MKKVGEALLPQKGDLPEYNIEVNEVIEKFFRKSPTYFRIAIDISLVILQFLPILRIFKLKRPALFTSLDIRERYALLDKLRKSRFFVFRIIFITLKMLTVALYASRKEVKKTIGYPVGIGRRKRVYSPNLVRENIIECDQIDKKDFKIQCEVLVIGSGAGGAVVSKELAERGFDVAVNEEGFIPECDKLDGDMLNVTPELYRDAGVTFTLSPLGLKVQPPVLLPTGIALGGTTVVNEGTCFRIPDEVLVRWSYEFGIEDIDPSSMSKYFRKVERILNVHPVSVNLISRAAMKVAIGAEKLGYSYFPLFKNTSGCEGLGLCEFCCPIDAKRAMHVSYIPLATQYGAKFYTGFRAKWIEFKGKK